MQHNKNTTAVKSADHTELLWKKDFILILLVSLFTFFGFHMLLPTLPVFTERLSDASYVGYAVGIFTFTSILVRPFVGKMLDIYGRKVLLIFGLIIFAVCSAGYSAVTSLAFLLAIRLVHGFAWGISSTATGTAATDLIPSSRLGEGMGYFGLAGTLAMAVSPFVGLYVVRNFNFDILFMISTSMIVISIIISFFITYPESPRRSDIKFTDKSDNKIFSVEKNALRPTVIIFFVTMTYGAVVTFIALYAADRGVVNIGPFFTAYAVALAISRPSSGKIADKYGYNFVLTPGLIAVICAMLMLSISDRIELFMFSGIVYGIGFGTVQPALQALAVSASPRENRGRANASFYMGFDLGLGSGSFIWGAIATFTGYGTVFLLAAVPATSALLFHLYTNAQKKGKTAL